jgi:hypothetical protein
MGMARVPHDAGQHIVDVGQFLVYEKRALATGHSRNEFR